MMTAYTFGGAMDTLIRPAGLQRGVTDWKRRRRDPAIIDFVTGFDHRVLPDLRPDDVREVLDRSTHALGQLRKERDTNGFIANANPPWAMTYLFHACMERHLYRVPTWGEFYAFVTGPAAGHWWEPVHRSAVARGIDSLQSYRAALWRLGTAWQSAIRTVYTIATLRHEQGLDVRYHLYAHVELRIDGWVVDDRGTATHAFRIVMPNEFESRKTDPRLFFGGTGIDVHDLTVARQGHGQVWMPAPYDIAELAHLMRQEPTSQLPLIPGQSQQVLGQL